MPRSPRITSSPPMLRSPPARVASACSPTPRRGCRPNRDCLRFSRAPPAVEAAEADGFDSEATKGFLMLSWLTFKANDAERTRQATLLAAETSLAADDATRCQHLANTARCLMEVEFDVPRAFSLAGEAGALAAVLRTGFTPPERAPRPTPPRTPPP